MEFVLVLVIVDEVLEREKRGFDLYIVFFD